jgi:hypothetical protein
MASFQAAPQKLAKPKGETIMWKKVLYTAVAAAALATAGCKDRYDNDRGVGGAGKVDRYDNDKVDIGKNPGVINDGEGPLENNRGPLEEKDVDIGRNPGVINDNEGPMEQNRNTEPDTMQNNQGPLEDKR